ncbi:hypothetical protein AAMO2058_000720000 [Amorphochlora amoebiformis]
MGIEGVKQMLESVDTKDKIFYDLGSGLGAPIIAAAIFFPELKKLIGIELSPSRHETALKAAERLVFPETRKKISFLSKDMLTHPLGDADIVYISSLCFNDGFMAILGAYLDEQLKPGAIVMTSRELKTITRGRPEGRVTVRMSWNSEHKLHKYIMLSGPYQKALPGPEQSKVATEPNAEQKEAVATEPNAEQKEAGKSD